jgi:uncharacterized protein
MNCPRCETDTLDERDRDGVLIDLCRDCRGIWLDRGELEKLIARALREAEEAGAARPGGDGDDDDDDDHDHDDHDHDDHDHDDRRRDDREQPGRPARGADARDRGADDGTARAPRRRGWLESLGDLFD